MSSELHVRASDLARTVEMLRRWRTFVPLKYLIEQIRSGGDTSRLVALTFDDAYLSLATHARAVLVDLKVPATLFVVSDYASNPRPFWWDRLAALASAASVEQLQSLMISDHISGGRAVPRPSDGMTPARYATVVRDWILDECAGLLSAEVESAFTKQEQTLGLRTMQRSMTWKELNAFRREGEIDVGFHTVSHPALSLLDQAALRREIEECQAEVKARVQDAVGILAFPYGYFDERVIDVAGLCGIADTVSTRHDVVDAGRSTRALPRLMLARSHRPLSVNLLAGGAHQWRVTRFLRGALR